MDVIETETAFDACLEKTGQEAERLVPIEDHARQIGLSRRAAAPHARAGRIDTKEQEGQMYVVERPTARGDWFELGLVRAQAKTKVRRQAMPPPWTGYTPGSANWPPTSSS